MNIVTQQLTEEMFARRNEVAMLVAGLTGVPVDDIMGRCRRQRIADARKLVMWTLAVMCGYTRNNVGILMERNQSAVTYAVRWINEGYGGKDVERLRQEIEKKLKTIPTVAKNATVKRKEVMIIRRNELCKHYRSWVGTSKGEINCACVDEEKRTITTCDYTESKGCWKCPKTTMKGDEK